MLLNYSIYFSTEHSFKIENTPKPGLMLYINPLAAVHFQAENNIFRVALKLACG